MRVISIALREDSRNWLVSSLKKYCESNAAIIFNENYIPAEKNFSPDLYNLIREGKVSTMTGEKISLKFCQSKDSDPLALWFKKNPEKQPSKKSALNSIISTASTTSASQSSLNLDISDPESDPPPLQRKRKLKFKKRNNSVAVQTPKIVKFRNAKLQVGEYSIKLPL